MKTCPRCGEVKASTKFGKNRSRPDGLSFYCLVCNRDRNNRWYREHRRALGHEVRDHSWIPEGFRWCAACEQAVAHEDYTRNAGTASGFGSRCRACDRAANSASYFYRKYKLTLRGVSELRAAQDDRCAICGDPEPQHLDHDHNTGGTRQLLCQRCNHGLGLFRDDPHLLHAAAYYVEFHTARQEVAAALEAAGREPELASRPGEPPVGSRRRPGRAGSTRATGRTSGSRRRDAGGDVVP
jgi:hypothetical protein